MKLKALPLACAIFMLLIQSCKKEQLLDETDNTVPNKAVNVSANSSIKDVKSFLQENYSAGPVNGLDFGSVTIYNLPDQTIIRIPFRIDGFNNFLLISTDNENGKKNGVILHLNATSNTSMGEAFSGDITLRELNGNFKEVREVKKGYKQKGRRSGIAGRSIVSSVEPTYEVLPEVVVVGYRSTDGGFDYSLWLNLQSLINGSSTNWYGDITSSGGGGYSSNTLQFELDNSEGQPVINIEEYLNCFANLNSYGATYSVQLLVDIPVDGSPGKFISGEYGFGSVGHVSIRLMKFNDDRLVSQTFGFYPDYGPKSLLGPRPSKMVDNGAPGFEAEYNASITMSNITAEQFADVIAMIRTNRYRNYDLERYNCTNFALDAFNSIRGGNPLHSSPFLTASESPQGLYSKLSSMKAAGHPNIETGVEKKVNTSTGSCR